MRHGLESKRIWSTAVVLAFLAAGIARAERYWINDHYDNVLFQGRVEQPVQG